MLLVVTAVWLLPPAAGATATDGAGAASSGWTEQQESRIDSNSKRMKIAGDIACSMCTYIAEDLWTTLLGDWASATKRGEFARSRGAHRTAREMLEQLCAANSPMLPHFVDMYDIQDKCLKANPGAVGSHSRGRVDCSLGQQWHLDRVEPSKPTPSPPDSKEMNAQYQ
eukprot:gene30072-24285_t